MRRWWGLLAVLAVILWSAPAAAQGGAPAKPLDIYVVDPEGGKATLWVTPAGQAVLIDAGNPGERDLTRLMEVITAAGVTKIDFLVTTHYHIDHIGGMAELVKRVPVDTFVDHGPSVEDTNGTRTFWATYTELFGKAKRLVVKPGDRVPVTGLDWRIVSGAGNVLKTPIEGAPGAGSPNAAACAASTPKPQQPDTDENVASTGSVVTFGQFRAIDLGDLFWKKEMEMMCPTNPIGTVDVLFVTHHGLDASNPPALVHGVSPRVAIMQNGTTKGAAVDVMKTLRSSPRLEDIWQIHWSYAAGIEHNAPGLFIANLEEPAVLGARMNPPPPDPNAPAPQAGRRGRGPQAPPHTPAYFIKVSVQPDGSFTVTNSRNGFSKTYAR